MAEETLNPRPRLVWTSDDGLLRLVWVGKPPAPITDGAVPFVLERVSTRDAMGVEQWKTVELRSIGVETAGKVLTALAALADITRFDMSLPEPLVRAERRLWACMRAVTMAELAGVHFAGQEPLRSALNDARRDMEQALDAEHRRDPRWLDDPVQVEPFVRQVLADAAARFGLLPHEVAPRFVAAPPAPSVADPNAATDELDPELPTPVGESVPDPAPKSPPSAAAPAAA